MEDNWGKGLKFEIALFALYLLLALVWTWPLAANLNNSIYGVRGDHFAQLWESWWRKNALLSGESLTFTPLIYAPSGFDFSSFPIQPLPTILNLGLTLLTNEVLALNILLLLGFPLAGLAAYYLVRKCLALQREDEMRLLGDCKARPCSPGKAWPCCSLAAAFSGLVYAFSMYHFSHAWEHSTLISICWMPFYVLALVNLDEKKNVKSAVLAALVFAAVFLDNFYYGYMMVFFSILFVLIRWKSFLNQRGLKLLLLFAFCSLLVTSPVVFPLVKKSLSPQNVDSWLVQESYERSLHDLNWFSARPWYYLLPSTYHPLWGRVSKSVLDWLAARPPEYLTKPYARVEHNLYLTWTALILSAVAVLRSTRRVNGEKPDGFHRQPVGLSPSAIESPKANRVENSAAWVRAFLALGIAMAIFSAPPYAVISGFKIYFPSYFLHKIFPMFSAYARFGVLVLLCVSVLAGFGAKFLLERIKNKKLLPIAYCLLPALAILEVLLPSFNVNLTPPEVYRWLKEQPGDFIVIEFPPRTDHSGLLYQRIHGKRLFDPVLENAQDILHAPAEQISSQALLYRDIRERPEEFARLGVKYVIFHEGDPFLPFNLGYFGEPDFKRIYLAQGIAIYEIVKAK